VLVGIGLWHARRTEPEKQLLAVEVIPAS
jgi:hypothetical protein